MMKTGDTEMMEYKYESNFYRFITNNQKEVVLDEKNADWHLFQIGRDLSLTKCLYEQKKFRSYIDGMLPESFQTEGKDYNITETNAFIDAIGSFIHYLEKSEKPLRTKQENVRTLIENCDQMIRETNDQTLKRKLEAKKIEYISEFNRSSTGLIAFVSGMMSTKIKVVGGVVSVYSQNDDLLQSIEKELSQKNIKFVVMTKEDASE